MSSRLEPRAGAGRSEFTYAPAVRFRSTTRWVPKAAGAVALGIGAAHFALWLLGIPPRWSAAGAVTMKTNMALGMSLAGLSLWLLEGHRVTPRRRLLGRLLAALVFLVGSATLFEYVTGVDLGIDQLFAVEPPGQPGALRPNRMGPPGALGLTLIGTGLLGLSAGRRLHVWLGVASCSIVLIPAVGMLYGSSTLHSSVSTAIAWPTAIGLGLLGLGLCWAEASDFPVPLLWRDDPGGELLRRLLAPAIVLPIAIGWVRLLGERHQLYERLVGTTLFALALSVALSLVLWRSASRLSAVAAERSRSQAESLWRATLLELSHDAIFVWSDTEGIESWNRGAESLYGYTAGEALGRLPQDLLRTVFPRSLTEVETDLRRVGRWQGELRHRTRAGAEVTVLAQLQAVRGIDGKLRILESNRDISEVHRTAERLRESEERYRTLFLDRERTLEDLRRADEGRRMALRAAELGTWSIDPTNGELAWDERARAIFGLATNVIPYREFVETVVDPADRARLDVAVQHALDPEGSDHERPIAIEYRVRGKDGAVRWIEVKGEAFFDEVEGRRRAVRFVGTAEDITAQRQVEEELRASEAKFRSVFEQAAIGMGRVRFDDARWVDVNAAFCRMVGYTREELQQKPWPEITHPDDVDLDLVPFRRMAAGDLASYTVEKRFRHQQGHDVWARLTLSLVRDAEGRPDYEIAIIEDIGDRKRAEDALRRAKERLEEADRRKDEFLGVLSHELRNPLTPIRNAVYLLGRAVGLDERGRNAVAVIDRQSSLLSRLIDDLLDVTRIARGKVRLQRSRFELGELVRQVAEDHRSAATAGHLSLELDVRRAPLWIDADRARLAQALGNLLQNAVKFTPPGGRIGVSLDRDERGRAVLAVEDTGVGIDPETLARLFQPFSQADRSLDRSRGGLGLGLAVTKGLLDLHAGTIEAFSEGVERGARFTLRLPLAAEVGVADASRPREVAAGAADRPLRVLVIEDNRDAADSLREVLEFGGHEVRVAYDGERGLAIARETPPDVVFCDIGLPGLDGYGVARAFRADPRIATGLLVALTGYAQPEDLRRATEAGFDRHLAKPPDLDALEGVLADRRADAARPGPRDRRTCRVLVVDDDEAVRESVATVLRDRGFEVLEARDGPECLSLIGSGAAEPAATLLDYRMPGLDGVQVFERLKSGGWGHSVVLMTDPAAAPVLAKKYGFTDYVGKPFGTDELLGLVRRVVGPNGCSPDGRQ